jgi:hypothetical protein
MALKPNLPRVIKGPGVKSIGALKKAGYKKAGAKYGPATYVLPKSAAPAAPAKPQSPYQQAYGQTAPWAIPLLEQIDTDQAQHQAYVTDKVMPWLSQGLAALTGVTPGAEGYNPTIQQQYLANVQGPVGNALNAVAAARPAAVASTTPGGATAAPNAYLGTAMGQYAAQRGGAAIAEAQAQQMLNTVQANTYAQGALRTIADYAAGLPAVYVQKRNELRSKIDQWVAEQSVAQSKLAETMRHNRVSEATAATNAESNAAIAMANLGLKNQKLAVDTAIYPDVPVGYVQLPNGKIVKDPTYVNPSKAADKSLTADRLKKQGFIGGWKVKPKAPPTGTKGAFVQASDDGRWYIKQGTAGTATKVAKPSKLSQDLAKLYLGPALDGFGGWQEEFDGRPKDAAGQVVRFILDNKASFAGSNRQVNITALQQVLSRIPDSAVRDNVLDILDRGYISNNRWRPT